MNTTNTSGNVINKNLIIFFTLLLFIYGWLSVNVYLPALPSLSTYFHTGIEDLKLSITLFLAGFAISQLFWGFYSEKYGRRKPLLIGLGLVLVGTLMTLFSPNVEIFNAGRFIEALGLGSGPVAARAALTDLLNEKELRIAMAYATISTNIMPAIAPIIGGNILHWWGWRYIFVFLLVYGFSLLIAFWHYLPETSRRISSHLKFSDMTKHYYELFTHRKFLGYALPYMLVSGSMIGYYAITPFIFITHLGVSAKNYGYLSLISVGTYILGAVANRFFSHYFTVNKVIFVGIASLLISVVLFLIFAEYSTLKISTVLLPISFFTFAAGLISPSCNAAAMTLTREKAGTANAVLSGSIYASSAIMTAITTSLPLNTLFPLALFVTTITILVLIQFLSMVMN